MAGGKAERSARLAQAGQTSFPQERGLSSPQTNIVAPRGDDKYLQVKRTEDSLKASALAYRPLIFWRFPLWHWASWAISGGGT